jgi:hypothetical protein
MTRDNFPIDEKIHYKLADFIPVYGFYKYVKRNSENSELSSCFYREAFIGLYNTVALWIGLSALAGLEKLLK